MFQSKISMEEMTDGQSIRSLLLTHEKRKIFHFRIFSFTKWKIFRAAVELKLGIRVYRRERGLEQEQLSHEIGKPGCVLLLTEEEEGGLTCVS